MPARAVAALRSQSSAQRRTCHQPCRRRRPQQSFDEISHALMTPQRLTDRRCCPLPRCSGPAGLTVLLRLRVEHAQLLEQWHELRLPDGFITGSTASLDATTVRTQLLAALPELPARARPAARSALAALEAPGCTLHRRSLKKCCQESWTLRQGLRFEHALLSLSEEDEDRTDEGNAWIVVSVQGPNAEHVRSSLTALLPELRDAAGATVAPRASSASLASSAKGQLVAGSFAAWHRALEQCPAALETPPCSPPVVASGCSSSSAQESPSASAPIPIQGTGGSLRRTVGPELPSLPPAMTPALQGEMHLSSLQRMALSQRRGVSRSLPAPIIERMLPPPPAPRVRPSNPSLVPPTLSLPAASPEAESPFLSQAHVHGRPGHQANGISLMVVDIASPQSPQSSQLRRELELRLATSCPARYYYRTPARRST